MADSPVQPRGPVRTTAPHSSPAADSPLQSAGRTAGRLLLGMFLVVAGVSHLTLARVAFRAQVPPWLPLNVDFVVMASGLAEIGLGFALLLLRKRRIALGWIVAAFFVAVFPGNISQFATGTDSFGLNSDLSRGIRLAFQPLLVFWALWSTGAWRAWRETRRSAR
ncbi:MULTISPECIES: DoxX family protein [unclassified Arthrobacter]|uniref:DoxX family protein n=1 Tax=unclassified Arthrobacter TaxID=235627 RepID=UPI002DF7D143|nr:putative membrane protein [Arthrobacter sp. MP_M4]MEC5202294.1 putative membrane protein [Arthrobacter sp. MP_M7]